MNDTGFDLFRLSKSKSAVDLSPNTLRAWHENGLPFYRMGKVVFVSRRELEMFIRLAAARPEISDADDVSVEVGSRSTHLG